VLSPAAPTLPKRTGVGHHYHGVCFQRTERSMLPSLHTVHRMPRPTRWQRQAAATPPATDIMTHHTRALSTVGHGGFYTLKWVRKPVVRAFCKPFHLHVFQSLPVKNFGGL
jgi:hypothetical protein